MDSLIYGLILAIVAAIVAYLIGYSKRKGWDDAIGEKIETYNFLFTVMGTIIRSIDEKLYNEMTQVIDKLNAMLDEVYADPEFTGYLEEMGYNLWDAKGDEVQAFIEEQMDSMDRYVELLEGK